MISSSLSASLKTKLSEAKRNYDCYLVSFASHFYLFSIYRPTSVNCNFYQLYIL